MGVVVYRTQEVFKMHELRQKNLEFLLHSEALKVVWRYFLHDEQPLRQKLR